MAHDNPELRRHMAWLDRNGLYVWGVFYKFKMWSTIYISNDCYACNIVGYGPSYDETRLYLISVCWWRSKNYGLIYLTTIL